MTWGYRILRYPNGDFGLHEVVYNKDGDVDGHTEEPTSFVAHSEEGPGGVIASLKMALRDAKKHSVIDIPSYPKTEATP